MKVVVISDSHGNIANVKHVMEFALKVKCKAVIHCGDWNTLESVETVLRCRIPVYGVLGNADIDKRTADRLQRIDKKRFNKDFLKFEIGGRKIGVVHSFSSRLISSIESLSIVFSGHKHRQQEYMQGGVKIVNPGALENNISFAIYDTDTNKVKFLSLK